MQYTVECHRCCRFCSTLCVILPSVLPQHPPLPIVPISISPLRESCPTAVDYLSLSSSLLLFCFWFARPAEILCDETPGGRYNLSCKTGTNEDSNIDGSIMRSPVATTNRHTPPSPESETRLPFPRRVLVSTPSSVATAWRPPRGE